MRILLLSFSLLLVASCSQDSSPIAEEQQRVIERGAQLRLALIKHDRGTQMQMYRALSAADKSAIWKAKLSQLDQTGFSAEQNQFIQEVLAFASNASNFERNSTSKFKEQSERLDEFSLKASRLFNEKYKVITFGVFETINEETLLVRNINSKKPSVARASSLCECRWGFLCPQNEALDGGCADTLSCGQHQDCGFLGLQLCTGMCIPVQA